MLTSPLEIINRLYPKARITSGYRSPNHPLSRANPSSAHIHGTPDNPGAVDVAPIPGVAFADYVASLKREGLPVSGARDEAAHPMPWTTGPNWHVSLLGQRQAMPQKRKPMTLAELGKSAFPMEGGFDPLAPTPEPYYAPQQQAAPQTLADLGQSIYPVAANGKDPLAAKKPGAFDKGGMGWKILGVLGDSYLQANGMPGNYVPQLQKQRAMQAEADQRREEFAQRLQLEREQALAKAAEPPAAVQTAMYWEALKRKDPAKFGALMGTMDSVSPNYEQVTNDNGYVREVRKDRVQTKTIGDQTYYNIDGKWYAAGGQ